MSKKTTTVFVCENCGHESFKWLGRCPRCMNWDTMREFTPAADTNTRHEKQKPVFASDDDVMEERTMLGINEMDRVLGGGLTVGSAILLGGDPGIGKTTLCFDIAARMAALGLKALYVSGEESLKQLASRKKRLGLDGFPFLVTNQLDDILDAAQAEHYDLIIIDSIQSVYNSKLPMLPGSMSQIRDVSTRLTMELKALDTAMILIGHVTKEGAIAGPKILEHTVDTVLYFEGDKMLPYRMLRSIKNRFGAVDEVGIFQMTKDGLASVENPSEFFVSERSDIAPGSAIFPYMSGSRPILLEVQAITQKTNFSIPRRLSLGYDVNRLYILLSVVEKAIGKSLFDRDVYVNITGGMKVNEPAVDLCVAASMLSSYRDANIGHDAAFFGEIGLTGEIRKIVYMDQRIRECARLGIQRIFGPKGIEGIDGIKIIPLRNVRELYEQIAE
ncbi:MAG TPA: DNA repair protein RadA [Syntrophorhabdaceae bacterium]|nr:DNA repair protein RadA [Syntrophorhabdaceae bacterium]